MKANRIYVGHGLAGINRARPGLSEALAACRSGDTLVVTKLDRLARSLSDARNIVEELTEAGVKLNVGGSVHDPTEPVGRLLFNVLGMIAGFERDLIRERTHAGLAAARARGRKGGRPTVMTPAKAKQARKMIDEGTPLSEVADVVGVSRSTLYRQLLWKQDGP